MSQTTRILSSLVAAAVLSGAVCVQANVIDITSNTADTRLSGTPNGTSGSPHTTGSGLTAGFEFAGRSGGNYYDTVLVFKLPSLAAGETIQSANLQVYIDQNATDGEGDLDVYGLGYREASTVLASDWYGGGALDPNTNATLIQASLATPADGSDKYFNTDDSGDAALATYLQDQYSAGAVAGDFVFLRLNTDSTDGTRYYRIQMADSDTSAWRPVLSITTSAVPEPATLGLLALGGLMLAGRRKRRV